MTHHLIGWTESQAAATLTQVAALVDQSVSTSGDDIFVPEEFASLGGVFAGGTTISQAQITAPSLRKTIQQDVSPINIGAEPLSPPDFMDMFDNPRPLTPGEGLRARIAQGSGDAEYEHVLAFLVGDTTPVTGGEIFTVRCTSTTTLTAYAWSLCTLTFSQQLEAGRYAVVGMKAISAGAIAARLVLAGESHRPGVIGCDAESDFDIPRFRNGGLGNWGEFDHTYPPQVEFLSVSADTSEVVYLDLVKIS